MNHPRTYDVIVVGGGHAGTEAALASARTGAATLLLTQNIDTLGQMSCNPAIGGIGKGHLVKEIDALGGAMATAADRAGIHFRILNGSKGPAVRATRAQADRVLYKQAVRRMLEKQANLDLFQQQAADLLIRGDRVVGVVTQMGLRFTARAVVLTAGTFLAGRIHIGEANYEGGRAGDQPSNALACRLRELALPVGRLKTGTPPRIDRRSVDFSLMAEQPGDDPAPVFSFRGSRSDHPCQVACYITRTNPRTHELIRAGLDRSPLYTGAIEGVGPRYCPSIEDKVVRFADRDSHQIFVEPEGLDSAELYPNGISTSLPFDTQYELVRSIRGFEHAHITRAGYAIEYDFFDPRALKSSLETKALGGLFFAGQINGTTGYEEAAAQGVVAGLNAARQVRGLEPWLPTRDEAYIGVMIDDLITRGTAEPYRMFTSRAEYRLLLREDNADLRLTEKGRQLGLVNDQHWEAFSRKRDSVDRLVSMLRSTRAASPTETGTPSLDWGAGAPPEGCLMDWLRRPEVTVEVLAACFADLLSEFDDEVIQQVAIQAKYTGYIERQQAEIDRSRRFEHWRLPEHLDYRNVVGLSNEVRDKLQQQRPETVGQAARISGMTPAAVTLLIVHLKKSGQ